MKNRLILVEGIPGSGKSTIANKIKRYLEEQGIHVRLYSEGDSHPADLAWNSYIPIADYQQILKSNEKHKRTIEEHTRIEDDYAIVAYTKLDMGTEENQLMNYFEEHEVYNSRIDLDLFKKIHFKRWEGFANNIDDNSVFIFECAYLQNHVNELLAYHNKDVNFIIGYMLELIETVKSLNPKLIYLSQGDVYETIERVAKERVSTDKNRWDDWIDLVISYIENSPYGQKHELKGFKGVIDYFEARRKVELAIIDRLSIDKAIIQNSKYDWEEVFKEVVSELAVK